MDTNNTRTRWQYRVVNIGPPGVESTVEILTALGQDGWDLASTFESARSIFVVMKRPVAPGEEPEGDWSAFLKLSKNGLVPA